MSWLLILKKEDKGLYILKNINKLHSTELGFQRIIRNLSLEEAIDAENETEIDTYRALEIGTIRTDKLKMEEKTEALTNKLQKHEKHLLDIIELEVHEALLVYQACLPDMSLESERIKELLQQYDIFDENVVPEEFLKRYKGR